MFVDHTGNGVQGAGIYAVVVDNEVRTTFRSIYADAKTKAMSYYGHNVNVVILYQLDEATLQWNELFRICRAVTRK